MGFVLVIIPVTLVCDDLHSTDIVSCCKSWTGGCASSQASTVILQKGRERLRMLESEEVQDLSPIWGWGVGTVKTTAAMLVCTV